MEMRSLQVGDYLWELPESPAGPLVPVKIILAKYEVSQGLFNPHTSSGTILVDNIAALSFTETVPRSPAVHFSVTLPISILSWLCPAEPGQWLNDFLLYWLGNKDNVAIPL